MIHLCVKLGRGLLSPCARITRKQSSAFNKGIELVLCVKHCAVAHVPV